MSGKHRMFQMQVIVFLTAIIGALIMTAVYGKFKHDRYYNGTIEAVQKTQINLSISMLQLLVSKRGPEIELTINDFERAFEPVLTKKFMPLKIYKNGNLIFQSNVSYKPIKIPKYTEIQLGGYQLEFGIYGAPPWFIDDTAMFGVGKKARYWRWLGDPKNWFSGFYDYIHVPFLSFLGLFYFFIFSFAYRFRANYLSDQVIVTLEEIKKHQADHNA
jgi:hypothetical protein